MIKFSVLIVSLNSGIELINTVNNVLQQKNVNYEIIIKDGCSTDGSVDSLPHDKRITLVRIKDSGIYHAMNQAVEYATGDFCIFMNCGDYFYEDEVLSKIADNIKRRTVSANTIFYGNCYTVNRNITLNYPKIFNDYVCFTKVLCHQATIYPTVMLKKRVFSERYKIAADYEYYVYAYIHGTQLIHIPIIIAGYRGDGASEKQINRIMALKESKEIRKRYFPRDRYIKTWIKVQLHGIGIKQFMVKQEWFYPYYKKIAGLYYNRRIENVSNNPRKR